MLCTRFGVGCLALLLAAEASAGALEPKKPSDVVTLTTSGTVCPDFASAMLLDRRITPDGTQEPFVVPAKRVLVITKLEVTANGVASLANHSIGAALVFGASPSFQTPGFVTARADADGVFSIHEPIPPGIVVGPGTNLCIGLNDLTGGGSFATGVSRFAYGFLAA